MLIKRAAVLPVTAVTPNPSVWGSRGRTDSSFLQERGTKIHPGKNVGIGSDDTLYAKASGVVRFEHLGRDKKQVSVYEQA